MILSDRGDAGEKLIDHLKKWLEPEKLLAVTHSWEAGQECHIAAAILDLFHLLPPPAVKFLETGVSHQLTLPYLVEGFPCITSLQQGQNVVMSRYERPPCSHDEERLRCRGMDVVQERPGLVVLMIELEAALAQMPANTEPTKMWSPYREPLARFLNKYPEEVCPRSPSRPL